MISRRSLLALILVVLVTAPLSAQEPAQTVPFKLLPSRHIVVSAKVNGKGPYSFIFDTGAPINLISNKVAKDAGLSTGGGPLAMLLSGPQSFQIPKLTLGPVTAEKVPAIVMDHPTVKVISDAFEKETGPIQGIIGFPFFARYAMTVDYEKSEFTLKPTDYKPGDYLAGLVDRLNTAAAAGNKPKVFAPAGFWGLAVEKAKSDTAAGVSVESVIANAPAAKAGLKPGDRILTIDGRWTDSVGDTAVALSAIRPGRPATVVLTRDGKTIELTITPAKGL